MGAAPLGADPMGTARRWSQLMGKASPQAAGTGGALSQVHLQASPFHWASIPADQGCALGQDESQCSVLAQGATHAENSHLQQTSTHQRQVQEGKTTPKSWRLDTS